MIGFDDWEAPELEEEMLDQLEGVECMSLEPELWETPESEQVLVLGNPFEVAGGLDDCQGDNLYGAEGNCGLVSVMNLLRLNGQEIDENEIVGRALETNPPLCVYYETDDPGAKGGTTVVQRAELLQLYGISSHYYSNQMPGGSLEQIASYVENGQGVNLSVNAGYLWDNVNFIDDGSSNHSIIVTGTAREPESGELQGLFVCDSGLTDQESGAMYVSVEKLEDAYVRAPGATVLVTDQPLR